MSALSIPVTSSDTTREAWTQIPFTENGPNGSFMWPSFTSNKLAEDIYEYVFVTKTVTYENCADVCNVAEERNEV